MRMARAAEFQEASSATKSIRTGATAVSVRATAVLPGLADLPMNRLKERTPSAWLRIPGEGRELAELQIAHSQRRDDHWAIVNLIGKGGHIRTVPVPDWVKNVLDQGLSAADTQRVDSFDVYAVLANCGASYH
jgi:hypothetical protein